jgi:hypothetical protein
MSWGHVTACKVTHYRIQEMLNLDKNNWMENTLAYLARALVKNKKVFNIGFKVNLMKVSNSDEIQMQSGIYILKALSEVLSVGTL